MDLKACYKRFRAWQVDPFKPKTVTEETHRCANCSQVFQGNYCPRCGQAQEVGRVGWGSLFKEIRDHFGSGDPRSLLTFIVQLFVRPGYMIGDYLRGRRQVCRSPAARLILFAGVTLLVLGLVRKTGESAALEAEGAAGFMATALNWLSAHLDWAVLIQTVLLVFPTWLLFRNAPAYPDHTWPEGIYIQLFMGSLVLICIMLRALLGKWMVVFIPLYYFIAYRQLFGYGIWGTLWRVTLCFGMIFCLFGFAMWMAL